MACERQTFLSIIAAEERFARWNETKRPETFLSEDERGETSARRFLKNRGCIQRRLNAGATYC